jgi:hypothetical protein
MALIDRYRKGDHEQVWDELIGLGPRVRDAAVLPDAMAVADETMLRARRNIERLIDLLPKFGWTFQHPIQGESGLAVWTPPSQEAQADIAQLETEMQGPVPISIGAWWRIVGGVDLTRKPGSGPPSVEYPDPLVVLPVGAVMAELNEWAEDDELREMRPVFAAPLAPDAYHKEDVSGGAPYEMELPAPSADAMIMNMTRPLAFVAYLRHAFQWAGLPGYAEAFDERPSEISAIADRLEAL